MPFLRFTRDKRGYENTYLMHAFRRHGKTRPRILYWFRTPPGVRVGRAALDEDAIRAIEQNNPELTFDWTKILDAQPSPAEPELRQADGRNPRRRDKDLRRGARAPTEGQRPANGRPLVQPFHERPASALERTAEVDDVPSGIARGAGTPSVDARSGFSVAATEQIHTSRAVEELLGSERFSLLRARYAELQARISERREDPAKLEEWRRQAERLNPDTWVTVDEAKAALERYEADFETLHIALGRRRRRSRRGGARRTRRRRAAVARSAEQQGAQSSPSEASAEPGSVAGERPDDDHEV